MPKSATVLLIRHAEKPTSPDDHGLIPAGQARAHAYVAYFQNLYSSGSRVATPSHLIAAADSVHSARSRLTSEPLAAALGLMIDASIDDHDIARMAAQLLGDPRYDGVTTLVCWHHGQLLALAAALGAPVGSLPVLWPDAEFGWLVQLDFDAAGNLAAASACNQRLMFDDRDEPLRGQ